MNAKAIFVGGTSSNAGKSWMATAICAWLRQRGVAVAPFKAQNMSNNSYPCRGGGEIGRAQVAQAEACGLEPEPAMNPILLKPNGGSSQVVVNGRVWKTLPPRSYYAHFDELLPQVLAAYADLASRFEVVVIEGAGSVSELNLREFDLVNLGLVTRIQAPWLLVADIERGGVFASVLGTVGLLTARGARALSRLRDQQVPGRRVALRRRRANSRGAHRGAVLGVFPYADDLRLDAEDSLSLDVRPRSAAPPRASVAIVRFPHVSNATDFRLLTWADWVTAPPAQDYDYVILPGSKNTIADLQWLRDRGLGDWIAGQRQQGATIVGVCGGFQMLGRMIHDPSGAESSAGSAEGLGLLPAETILTTSKTTRVVGGTTVGGVHFTGYEIHLGVTSLAQPLEPFARLDDGTSEGVRAPGIIGTYLHGAFESAAVCSEVFGTPVSSAPKDAEYHRLAEWFDRHSRGLDALGL